MPAENLDVSHKPSTKTCRVIQLINQRSVYDAFTSTCLYTWHDRGLPVCPNRTTPSVRLRSIAIALTSIALLKAPLYGGTDKQEGPVESEIFQSQTVRSPPQVLPAQQYLVDGL
jgi:hypothetical protein